MTTTRANARTRPSDEAVATDNGRALVDELLGATDPTPEQALELAVRFALLAPSARNVQPWAVERHGGATVRLYVDRTKRRPVADPADRELMISCGAALQYLGLALEALGICAVTSTFPRPGMDDLVAAIRITSDDCIPDAAARALVSSAPDRHTNWGTFRPEPATRAELRQLGLASRDTLVMLTPVLPSRRHATNVLIQEAHERQMADPRFVAEWRRTGEGRGDEPLTDLVPYADDTSGSLLVLSTQADDDPCWLQTGRALARVLLSATRLGLAVTFLNQPIQVPELRQQLVRSLDLGGDPQILVRVGHPSGAAHATPRRSLDDVSRPLIEPW